VGFLEWRDDFRIGIPEVDHEHRELIGLINALHTRLVEPGPGAGIGAFLGELHAQIAAHFALEEKVMRSRRYAEFDDHKHDHERLLDEIREIMDGYELHGRYDASALGEALDTWFGEHFRTRDAKLHAALGDPRS
jgi:hemerythrin-like metal-binding protein